MSFETAYKKSKYVDKAREKLQEIYSFGDRKTTKRSNLHDQLEGYFQAGLLMQIVCEDDIRTMVDEEHHLAFGTSLKERRIKKAHASSHHSQLEKIRHPDDSTASVKNSCVAH